MKQEVEIYLLLLVKIYLPSVHRGVCDVGRHGRRGESLVTGGAVRTLRLVVEIRDVISVAEVQETVANLG